MNKKTLMVEFINKLQEKKELTLFIKNLFDYENFNDYNYIFRLGEEQNRVIIDIYDNISLHRFNRYIFSFTAGEYDIIVTEESNVFVSFINVLNVNDSEDKLLKLAYLFKIPDNEMIDYANTFMDSKHITILEEIIDKNIIKPN